MKNRHILYLVGLTMAAMISYSCKEFLDVKPDASMLIPTTLDDCQLMLNDPYNAGRYISPGLSELMNDDFVATYARWSITSIVDVKSLYIWDDEAIPDAIRWFPYKVVMCANATMEILADIETKNEDESRRKTALHGSALFLRGYAFLNLAQVYAPAYDAATAQQDQGIPLRLTASIMPETMRANCKETYARIIQDFTDAIEMLPEVALNQVMPNKAAGYAALARTYILMRDYPAALEAAQKSLALNNTLLDFNNITGFTRFNNPEVTYAGRSNGLALTYFYSFIKSELYEAYENNDRRKSLFFATDNDGNAKIMGSYSGSNSEVFSGTAVDEVYLIRAECYARAGEKDLALADLNTLLEKRYNTTFIPVEAATAGEALKRILLERRKELIYRDIRWGDIKRLNKEPEFAVTLRRTFVDSNETYTLPPNDKRYVLLLPQEVIDLSGMPQTLR